jgi:MFS family permease
MSPDSPPAFRADRNVRLLYLFTLGGIAESAVAAAYTLQTAYVNDRTRSEVRATVLSVAPLGTSIAFALAAPCAGVVGDVSLRLAFGGMAATILLLAGGAFLLWLRSDRTGERP